MFEKTKSEDYMGMVSWSKLSGGARPMFGTEIETANPIRLTISHAEEVRDLSRYWFHPKKKIVEIEMSPIQWAEFLTSSNTSGIPCTIKQIDGEYMSEPKSSEIMKHYDKEVEEHFDEFDNSLRKIDEIIKSAIDSNKPMVKKALEELRSIIDTARYKTVADVKFVKDSFKEDMEGMITKAKAEFNAYVENRVHEIGIETIKKDSVKFLENKDN
jgi:F0F1-type ATP synthase membrane subunit b/b'